MGEGGSRRLTDEGSIELSGAAKLRDPDHKAAVYAWLAARGFRVLRFDNKLIGGSDYVVLNRISAAVGKLGPIGEI